MKQVIEAPNYHVNVEKDFKLFLAGGITGCFDWQSEVISQLRDDVVVDYIVFNPRRKDFDTTDEKNTEEQIKWEHYCLLKSSVVAFWFPSETLCPITLFELGKCLGLEKKVIVGCHPDYQRKIDLRYQTKFYHLVNSKVHESFEDFIKAINGLLLRQNNNQSLSRMMDIMLYG